MDRIEQQKKDLEQKSKDYLDDDSKTEVGNTYAAMKQHKSKMKSKNVLYFLETTKPKLENLNLLVTEFNTNSFKITDGIKTVEFYPSSGKLMHKGRLLKTGNDLCGAIMKILS